jgi:hypothetical protein
MIYRGQKYGLILEIALVISVAPFNLKAQTASFDGQAMGWLTMNPSDPFQFQSGIRYIPKLSLSHPLGRFTIDGEFSANLWSSATRMPDGSYEWDNNISPYRLWVKFSGNQLELRAGLQKINFGSAQLFRPLMWFDRIDPRDPLQLTDGVYGLLGRYYFLNNANIWLWGLYGDDKTKGWEVFPSVKNSIEYGGRIQLPLFTGETGFSYHHRKADPRSLTLDTVFQENASMENRIGIDMKMDLVVGFWLEGALIHQDLEYTDLEYKSLLNTGVDYTFNLGTGLRMMAEGFAYLQGKNVLGADESLYFGLVSASYSFNIVHSVNAMLFYDFSNKNLYRFINYSITFDSWNLYLIGFWNPDTYLLYNLDNRHTLYGGWGFQMMVVFNH